MKLKLIILYSCFISMIILSSSIVGSASTNTIELNPVADSYIAFDDPDVNYGSGSYLAVTGEWYWDEVQEGGRKAYIMFSLSTLPHDTKIVSAHLELYFYSKNVDETSSISCFYCPDNNWEELLINWNNAPSYETDATDTNELVAFEDQWYSWDVTEAVKKAQSREAITLVLCREQTSGVLKFYSKDAYSHHPKLTISYDTQNDTSNEQPICSLSSNITAGQYPLSVSFYLDASDSDGIISSWSLDINNDGSVDYSGSGNPPQKKTHVYEQTGVYTAKLTVTDNNGATIHDTVTITVKEDDYTPAFGFVLLLAAALVTLSVLRRKKANRQR